jgi:hypothetical protein
VFKSETQTRTVETRRPETPVRPLPLSYPSEDPNRGLFYFDASYRPRALQQQFIGMTEKKAIKRYQVMTRFAMRKCLNRLVGIKLSCSSIRERRPRKPQSPSVIWPSRRRLFRNLCVLTAPCARLTEEAGNVRDPNLRDLLPSIHHATLAWVDLLTHTLSSRHAGTLSTEGLGEGGIVGRTFGVPGVPSSTVDKQAPST